MKTHNSWQLKKLSEVCNFYNGLWRGKKPPFVKVSVIRNTNFTKNGNLNDSDIAYLDVESSQFEKRKLIYGDILLEKSGGGPKQPVGRVIAFNRQMGDFSFSNFTSAIRIKDSNELDFNYLHKFLFFFYISGATENMQSHSTGIRNLDLKKYKELEIPLPPLKEQKKIVKKLNEAFENIDKAKEKVEKKLQNSRELFESIRIKTFNNILKLGKVTYLDKIVLEERYAIKRGPFGSSLRKSFFVDSGYKVYEQKNAIKNDFSIGNYFINEKKFKELEAFKVVEGDIIISCSGTIGKVAIAPKGIQEGIINQALLKLSLDEDKMIKAYFKYFFENLVAIGEMEKNIKGAAIKNITSVKELKSIPIPIPNSIAEQKEIVKKLDKLSNQTRKLEQVYQQRLTALEELKKSILNKAFTGKL